MPSAGESYNPWRIFVGCFIPNVITRSTELSSTAKLVFGKLCQFAGENGKAYPSYSTLAREVGVKQRQAIRAVKELVVFGLIRPVKQNRPDGGSTSNIYEFIWHDIFITGMLTTPGISRRFVRTSSYRNGMSLPKFVTPSQKRQKKESVLKPGRWKSKLLKKSVRHKNVMTTGTRYQVKNSRSIVIKPGNPHRFLLISMAVLLTP